MQTHVARREVGKLFKTYLGSFPECTQTQLALLTEHDRADISNWVRGTRHSRVSDIDVLTRIADGLAMPDHARVLFGIAPAEALVGSFFQDSSSPSSKPEPLVFGLGSPVRLAICGSRSPRCDQAAIDASVRALARLVLARRCSVNHGPVGIGIEVMTYIADHYRPPDFLRAIGIFGRVNVVRGVHWMITVGGGAGTQDEIDIARSLDVPVLTIPTTGGTAKIFHEAAAKDRALRPWATDQQLKALRACATTEEYVRLIESVLTTDHGAES